MLKLFLYFTLVFMFVLCGCQDQQPLAPVGQSASSIDPENFIEPEFCRSGGRGAVNVLTRNVYYGADVDIVLGAQNPNDIPILVAQVFQMLVDSKFEERAYSLAREVKFTRPHLIALQEIALIRYQQNGDALIGNPVPATMVLYDYLQILNDALDDFGLNYKVAGMVENVDVELPMFAGFDDTGGVLLDDVRLTDFDVILARKDVKIGDVSSGTYDNIFGIPELGIVIKRGWVSAEARVGSKWYRFVNTHLEDPSVPELEYLQLAQAQELAALLAQEELPVLLAGDFNSIAPFGLSYNFLTADADYSDIWPLNRLKFDPEGYTYGHDADLRNEYAAFYERIDYIFVRDENPDGSRIRTGPVFATVVGDEYLNRTPSGLWPSDHGGVAARIVMRKGRQFAGQFK